MSEHKHTPGPWKCHPVSDKIANSFRWYSISGPETSQSVRDVLEKEVQANAELIARAPELLTENEALKAENERLRQAASKVVEAHNQYTFFLEGYRDGSASISEVTHVGDNHSKALEELFELTKHPNP